jgi:hypothetical protein
MIKLYLKDIIFLILGLVLGFIASYLLNVFWENRKQKELKKKYDLAFLPIAGMYTREVQYNRDKDMTSGTAYTAASFVTTFERLGKNKITAAYLCDGEFLARATYELGECELNFRFTLDSPNTGNGSYFYLKIESKDVANDIGELKVFRDPNDKNKLFVYHKNVVENGNAEGYEIWVKS